MSALAASVVEVVRPRVWVGCLSCYNAGRLVGESCDAEDAGYVTPDDLHGNPTHHEELWCLDLEGFPYGAGELSPSAASKWGELFAEVGEGHWPAFVAWVESGCHIVDADDLPIVSEFEELFCGCWDSFRDFADFEVEETGLLSDVPDEIVRYFDYDAYARDLRFDYIVADAPEGGVYLFRSC